MVLINLSTLKSGGGHTVALNFIKSLNDLNKINEYVFISVKGSDISAFLSENDVIQLSVSKYAFLRIIQEFFFIPFTIQKFKIKLIYSYFHYAFFIGRTKQVIGCADSNLFYPDIDFWGKESRLKRFLLRLKDKVRIRGIQLADGVIFENKALEERAHQLFQLARHKTTTIKPSVRSRERTEIKNTIDIESKVILILSGWHHNKNLLRLPEVAFYLDDKSIIFKMSLSLNNSKQANKFEKLMDSYGVRDNFEFTGRVRYENLETVYRQSNVCLLISHLESFSNNIIESWKYKTPLLITDADWSRNICGDAACYLDNTEASDIAKKLKMVLNDKSKQKDLISKGSSQLLCFNSLVKKTQEELSFINKFI